MFCLEVTTLTKFEDLLQYAKDHNIKICNSSVTGRLGAAVQHEGGKFVFIDFDRILSDAHKTVVLAHEIGHFETDSLNIDGASHSVARNERDATVWTIKTLLPRDELYNAMLNCDGDIWSIAETMGVTEELVRKAMRHYRMGRR